MNFKYYLNPYVKQNGTQSIRLKISTSKNDVQYIDSKISILKNQWDNKKQKIKRHALEDKLNAKLKSIFLNVENLHYDNKGATAKRLLQIIRNKEKYNTSSFLDFYQNVIDDTKLKKKYRTAKLNQAYHNKLKEYSNYISFNDLSVNFANEYDRWLTLRGNKTNTIAANFKAIFSVLNKAVTLGIIDKNPLKGYKITTENVEKKSLTYKQIIKLENYEIESRFRGKNVARDMLLCAFYCAGMRFSDVCRLKWKHIVNNDIVYTMNKSKSRSGSRRTIPMNPKLIKIFDKYKGKNDVFIFPPLYNCNLNDLEAIEKKIYISNNSLNRSLKYLDKELGFNIDLSMHVSKHSFTDYAVKNDVDILIISKLLGHTKLSTTEHYLKDFYHKEESAVISKLFKDN